MSRDDPPPEPEGPYDPGAHGRRPEDGKPPGWYGHPSAGGSSAGGQPPPGYGRPSGNGQASDPYGQAPSGGYGDPSGNGQASDPYGQAPRGYGGPSGNGQASDPYGQAGGGYSDPSGRGRASGAYGQPSAWSPPPGAYGDQSAGGPASGAYGAPPGGGPASGAYGVPPGGGPASGAYGPSAGGQASGAYGVPPGGGPPPGYGPPPAGGPPPGPYGTPGAYGPPGGWGPSNAYAPPPAPAGYQPGPPGYGVPWYQGPPLAPRRRKGPIIAVAVVAVIGLVAIGAVVLTAADPYPDEWDSRVSDLVDFVESERGLDFDHPVPVEFLSDEEYSSETRIDESTVTDADRTAMEEDSATLVALGLVPADLDLLEAGNDLTDSGTLAFYDPTRERVVVRGDDLTPALRGTLVHELTHVLQDQHFDLEQPPPTNTAGAYEAQAAIVEGDAMRIETAWVDTLSAADQDTYWNDNMSAGDASEEDLAAVPGALQAQFAAPYAFGEPLVTLLALSGGNDEVDRAFEDPPVTSEQLIDPRALFAGDEAVDVDTPEIPDGGDRLGRAGELGATTLLVALAERIDAFQALDAVDGWGGDSAVAYKLDGRTCLSARLVGDTPADTEELYQALDAWAATGPASVTSVAAEGDQIVLESCSPDPGAGTAPGSTRSLDVLGAVAARSFVMAHAEDAGYDHDVAFGVGNCAVRTATMAVITSDDESSAADFQHAIDECWPDD